MTNEPGHTPKIKLCGMSRPEDILAINQAKPDFCGFIVDFPKSHRNVSAQRAQELAQLMEPGIVAVAVVVDMPVEQLASLVNAGVITTVQLHGHEDEEYLAALRSAAPDVFAIQAFRVSCPEDVAKACQSSADMILLDSGQGSGASFDWSLTATANRDFLLAGGLAPGNLAAAIDAVHPWGVDMSSGIETDKVKDPAKIMAAVQEIRRS